MDRNSNFEAQRPPAAAADNRLAYHWLDKEMRAGCGDEPPWTVGELRTISGEPVLCRHGYHYYPTLFAGLKYRWGPVACLVEVSGLGQLGEDKGVARTRRLLAAVDLAAELRLFTCRCGERLLQRERKAEREPDSRSWQAINVARRYALGEADEGELENARVAAWEAARDAKGREGELARTLRASNQPFMRDPQVAAHVAHAPACAATAAYVAAWDNPGEAAWQVHELAGEHDHFVISNPYGWVYGGSHRRSLAAERLQIFDELALAKLLAAPRAARSV